MSGHSKWSTIKHKKAAMDAKRGNIFTKLATVIAVAVKKGGSGDPEINFSLRLAIERARSANMPNVNIERAIDRGLGKGDGGELSEFVLEGYGPGGVAIVIEIVTDNRNRIVAQVNTMLDKAGGSLAEPGSVLYLFSRVGRVDYAGKLKEDDTLELIELGAADWEEEEQGGVIWTELGKENDVAKYMMEKGYKKVEVEVMYKPSLVVEVGEKRKIIENLLEQLEENDDVQGVYANI
jgi:YebC/PmpR family DNA-binding regulatory protein